MWRMLRAAGAVGALVLGLAAVASAGFSDNELRAIYTQMKPFIRCGMTEAHLMQKYHGCAESSMICDGSLITVSDKGTCQDKLVFESLGGPDPIILLNGRRFPLPVALAPQDNRPPWLREPRPQPTDGKL